MLAIDSPAVLPDSPAPTEDWFVPLTTAGRRVTLRKLSSDDARGYHDAANAGDVDEVFRWLSVHPPLDLGTAAEHIAAADAAASRRERIAMAMIETSTGRFVGTTSYYEIVPALRTLAIGYTWFGQPWWRTGVNRESKLLLLTHAFEVLGAVRVVWHTDIRNERSQAAIAGLGARREGVLRKHRLRRDGTWRDTVQFAMTDEDWPGAKKRLSEELS